MSLGRAEIGSKSGKGKGRNREEKWQRWWQKWWVKVARDRVEIGLESGNGSCGKGNSISDLRKTILCRIF